MNDNSPNSSSGVETNAENSPNGENSSNNSDASPLNCFSLDDILSPQFSNSSIQYSPQNSNCQSHHPSPFQADNFQTHTTFQNQTTNFRSNSIPNNHPSSNFNVSTTLQEHLPGNKRLKLSETLQQNASSSDHSDSGIIQQAKSQIKSESSKIQNKTVYIQLRNNRTLNDIKNKKSALQNDPQKQEHQSNFTQKFF